ncbi:MAG: nucleotidyltransferase domain-containing protein [Nocardioides sp.]
MREPLRRTPQELAEDQAFFDRYGDWAPLDPPALAEFMAGFDRPWWIVGGWAIEVFTGAPREHEDVDLSILACDIPALREHVGDRWHLWSNHGGTLRPLDDRFPEVLDVESQIWIRRSSRDPWIIDLPITPDRDGRWTNKRLPDHVVPLEEATWVAGDGIRYLDPAIVLLYKAVLHRPKDDRDLDHTWPLLASERRAWLRDAVRRLYPEHPWLRIL